jgi:excisionase family DNA binding protein
MGESEKKKITDDLPELMTPRQVADLFRVDPRTVTRWAAAGKLASIRTLGGHRRFKSQAVKELLKEEAA